MTARCIGAATPKGTSVPPAPLTEDQLTQCFANTTANTQTTLADEMVWAQGAGVSLRTPSFPAAAPALQEALAVGDIWPGAPEAAEHRVNLKPAR